MSIYISVGIILLSVVFAVVLFGFLLYRFTFYIAKSARVNPFCEPKDQVYAPYNRELLATAKEMEETVHEDVWITAADGCRLHGRLYMLYPGQPVQLFMHGYHGTAFWDGQGCFETCKRMKHNLLLVDQRGHGDSEGNTTTFAIKESEDCLLWVKYMKEQLTARMSMSNDCICSKQNLQKAGITKKEKNIILSGVSMGAASVVLAAEANDSDIAAVIADCCFTSPKAIMQKMAREFHIPVNLGYFLVKLSAKWFGHFDIESKEPVRALEHITVPILFIQGSRDLVVSMEMHQQLFDACKGVKQHLIVEDAGHAVSALHNGEMYQKSVCEFLTNVLQ